MSVDLIIEPRKTYSWDQFKRTKVHYSIALDGIVNEGPKIEDFYLNLNHHEEVVREFTMATCKQSKMAIKGGLFNRFRAGSVPIARLYANDCDEDVCLSSWILKNHETFEGTNSNWRLNRLIESCNNMDITAGAYPYKMEGTYKNERKWIFDPYRQFRHSGQLFSATSVEMLHVIGAVHERIDLYKDDKAKRLEFDTRHEILYTSEKWLMTREIGSESREYLYSEGMNAFVAHLFTKGNGSHVYTIGRRSRFIDFPILKIFQALNKAEGISEKSLDKWGGSSIIGGSPRERASRLLPSEIQEVVNTTIGVRPKKTKLSKFIRWFRN